MNTGGRALGMGLLAGAAGIVVLLAIWLVVSGAHGGGIVLGLLLLLILAGPLAGAGAYILSRQPAEAQAARAFESKRRVLDSDQVFRSEIGDSLRRLAAADPALQLVSPQLRTLADELQSATHRSAAWQELVQLNDGQIETLQRYDDLVRERVRRLRDGAQDPQAALRELRQAVDQREDLLVRGRAAPSLAPSQLLTREAPTGAVPLEQLDVGDAVTHEGTDYVVENLATYFAEGQTWKLARLAATGAETAPAWLYVGSGALDIAWLAETASGAEDTGLERERSGTAVVDIKSSAGVARGVLVAYERARGGSRLALVEHWPDGVIHAYAGALIRATDLEVWPAARA